MSYIDAETGERCPVGPKLPLTKEDWHAKRAAVDTVLDDVGGIVTRVGDETVGEMWSLFDGQDVLNEIDPAYSEHIRHHVRHAALADPFHVSANTDPKGDRSRRPQDQDPDVLLHVVAETDSGIIVRGAKFETAAAYANQAFVKPTIGDWGDAELSEYAVGFVADMGAPGITHICRSTFAGRAPAADYPLSNGFDEIDTHDRLRRRRDPVGERLLPPAHAGGGVHPRHAAPLQHVPVRPAPPAASPTCSSARRTPGPRQTGVKMHQGVREKLAELACYRESINAHLTAAIEMGERSPGGLFMPNQALLDDRPRGRLHAAPGDDAPGPRPVRRPALRDPRRGLLRGSRDRAAPAQVLSRRPVRRGRPPPAVRVRARPPELRLRRPPAHLPALRPVTRRSPTSCTCTTPTTSLGPPTSSAATPACPNRWWRDRERRSHHRRRPRPRAAVQHPRHVSGAAARKRSQPGGDRGRHDLPARPGRPGSRHPRERRRGRSRPARPSR